MTSEVCSQRQIRCNETFSDFVEIVLKSKGCAMNFICRLPSSLSCNIISYWLELKDISRLDSAICVKRLRAALLTLLCSKECVVESSTKLPGRTFIGWLLMRGVKIQHFYISRNVDEELALQYMIFHGSLVTSIVREPQYTRGRKVDNLGLDMIKHALTHGNLASLCIDDTSVSFLDEIFSMCRTLTAVKISVFPEPTALTVPEYPFVTDLSVSGSEEFVLDVIFRCLNLKKLEVNDFSTDLADASLITIAEKNRTLRYLGLRNRKCSDSAFVKMFTLCTEIVNLDLSITDISDVVIENMSANLKHLRSLNVQNCKNLTNLSLHSLELHSACTLKVLWLPESSNITGDAILSLKSNALSLYVHWQLLLSSYKRLNRSLPEYAACTELHGFRATEEVLAVATQCPLLKVLRIFDPAAGNLGVHVHALKEGLREVVEFCPRLQTIIVDARDLQAMKREVARVSTKITVTNVTTRINVELRSFPL